MLTSIFKKCARLIRGILIIFIVTLCHLPTQYVNATNMLGGNFGNVPAYPVGCYAEGEDCLSPNLSPSVGCCTGTCFVKDNNSFLGSCVSCADGSTNTCPLVLSVKAVPFNSSNNMFFITFNKPMDPNSANPNTIKFIGATITGKFTSSSNSLIFTADNPLPPSFYLLITTGVTDLSGHHLLKEYGAAMKEGQWTGTLY